MWPENLIIFAIALMGGTLFFHSDRYGIVLAQRDSYCPPQEIILPCRCSQRGEEIQIWCSHSDLPRVLAGIKTVSKTINRQIDELILENNHLPSLPGRVFSPLRVLRLMLRHNGLERLSNGWLTDLEDSLVEVFIVERDLRSVPIDSLIGLRKLEAVTIQSENLKHAPDFSGLSRLRYINIQSSSLLELSPMGFRDLISLDNIQITGSPKLTRLEAGLFHDLPRVTSVNVAGNGLNWIHLRSLSRLPRLKQLDLSGNKITDAGMVGRAVKDLSNLEILKLNGNRITTLGEASFVDLPSLKELHLNENAITEIHHGAFHRTPSLKLVHLENNYLRRVHPESFLQASGSGVEILHLQHNDISRIEELRSLLDALPTLKFLDLSYNKLEVIPFGALRGHGTLEQLYLDNNMIRMIDRDAFMAMPGLRELRLRNNSLSDELLAPYWNLPGLKGLDLSLNRYRRIEPQLLMGLPSLRRLDISGNTLLAMNPSSFPRTPMLETINISKNEVTMIHPATFRNLDRLFEIDASDNNLQEMVPGLPRAVERINVQNNKISALPSAQSKVLDLPNLRMLDMSGNLLQRIPRSTLKMLPQLRILSLARNSLQTIDDGSLVGLTRLESLNMQDNKLTNLHERSLEQIGSLQDLNMQGNRLEELSHQLLENLQNLKRLDLSRNSLRQIHPETFRRTRSIEALDLSNNNLQSLPDSLMGMTNLKEVDISSNRLSNLSPDTVASWRNLEELRVSNNKLTEMRSGSFRNMPVLQYLDMSSNEVQLMEPGSIRNLPELQELVLADNRLNELHGRSFEDLPNLQAVHLQQNILKAIAPNTFFRAPSIVYLNLSTNNFRRLDHTGLRAVRSLEVLDLSNNGIQRVTPNSLRQLDWLVELNLDNNRICKVQGEPFSSMPRLRVLSMRNNRMKSMPESIFKNLRTNIAVLDLDGNPLDCSCNMLWYRSWLQESDFQYPGPRCRDGTMLRDSRLSRSDCQTDGRNNQLNLPLTNEHGDVFMRHLETDDCEPDKLGEFHNNLPPSPEESEYFDQYVDYPINDTHLAISNNSLPVNMRPGNIGPPLIAPNPVVGPKFNASNTLLNFNNQFQPPPQDTSAFTFFGMPIPSLNIGRFWGQGRNGNGRTTGIGTRGRGRVQVYRPDDPELTRFLNKNENYEGPRLGNVHEHPEISHRLYNGPVDYNHLPYRPYFQTPFQEPQIQKGGFIPMLPGSGGFTPNSDPFGNSTKNDDLYEPKNVTNISKNDNIWPVEFQEMVPLITGSPKNNVGAIKHGPIEADEIPHSNQNNKPEIGTSTFEKETEKSVEESNRSETITDLPTPSITEISLQSVISDLNSISRYEESELPNRTDSRDTVNYQTTTSPQIELRKNSSNNEIVEQNNSSDFNPKTPASLSDYNSKEVNKFWENPINQLPPSSLSALVAPGAQQGIYRSPPGRSTITKVFTPAPPPPILPSAEEFLRTTSTNGNHDNEVDSNELVTTTTVIDTSQTKKREDMEWYYANYNKTPRTKFDFEWRNFKNDSPLALKGNHRFILIAIISVVHYRIFYFS